MIIYSKQKRDKKEGKESAISTGKKTKPTPIGYICIKACQDGSTKRITGDDPQEGSGVGGGGFTVDSLDT